MIGNTAVNVAVIFMDFLLMMRIAVGLWARWIWKTNVRIRVGQLYLMGIMFLV